jgi:hypothetical protein
MDGFAAGLPLTAGKPCSTLWAISMRMAELY